MRIHNFSPGPSALPLPVLEQIASELVDYHTNGISLLEVSHRGALYQKVHFEAMQKLRTLLQVPDNYKILLLGGGATLQFGMIPLNLLSTESIAGLIVSGAWAKKALQDMRQAIDSMYSRKTEETAPRIDIIYDGSPYTHLPTIEECPSHLQYLHITSNETINGLQWHTFPTVKPVPLIADMSSDIVSRPIPIEKFGLIYAGAQKNLGVAGVTVVIIRDDLLDRCAATLPTYLSYRTHASSDSLHNTPPVFSIYVLGLILQWIERMGGIDAINTINQRKAAKIYRVIDESGGFYRNPIPAEYRSIMNIIFRLPSPELEQRFLSEAETHAMQGLKGHRSVGGLRISLYNAVPEESVSALASFMHEFAQTYG